MTYSAVVVSIAVFSIAIDFLPVRFRVLRCTCGRRIPWAFGPRHERHALLVTRALTLTILTVVVVFGAQAFVGVAGAAVSALRWWIVKRHGDGKRRWPARVTGRVGFNAHGRLVHVKETP